MPDVLGAAGAEGAGVAAGSDWRAWLIASSTAALPSSVFSASFSAIARFVRQGVEDVLLVREHVVDRIEERHGSLSELLRPRLAWPPRLRLSAIELVSCVVGTRECSSPILHVPVRLRVGTAIETVVGHEHASCRRPARQEAARGSEFSR